MFTVNIAVKQISQLSSPLVCRLKCAFNFGLNSKTTETSGLKINPTVALKVCLTVWHFKDVGIYQESTVK